MQMMGYTEDRDDGVAFPEGSEPNHAMILELVGDIILGRKELELYLAGTHPYPQFIEEHLSQKLLYVAFIVIALVYSIKMLKTGPGGSFGRVSFPGLVLSRDIPKSINIALAAPCVALSLTG